MSLYCLVYTSVSTQKMSDNDLKNLLEKSRLKNQGSNITGMLLYLDPYFIQVLEGEQDTIDKIFNTISQDARHQKVSIIYKQPLDKRYFSNWSMGFNKIHDEDVEHLDGFCDYLQQPNSEVAADLLPEIKTILKKFRNETLF
ncbi:MAG: BLUF domain-containing protein [Gammaproteobacteria bacterium]